MSTSTLAVERSSATWLSRLADYVELTKPRIATLVLVSVGVAYHVARWGQPEPWALLHVLLGTLLVASSSSAVNQWIERRLDGLMPRTADRPLPAGRLTSTETISFAVVTLFVGLVYLLQFSGWQPAFWAALTWVIYVALYTPLKTRSWTNTAVGAIAGALPILIGWSAGGSYDVRALSLFLLLFLWQFPHFMAIAFLYREQYERAGMEMLPVVEPSGRRAGQQATLAAAALIPVSLIPVMHAPGMGSTFYSVAVTILGIGQLALAVAFYRHRDRQSARTLLRSSLVYLPSVLLLLMLVPWL
jgi:protoheme IX farnesyltransferase